MNLANVFDRHDGDAVAIISRGRGTSYGELRQQVAGLRGGLQELGFAPGDRVAIVCGNNWYFVVSYLAALGSGLVAVPLNPTSPPLELQHQLAAVGARGVVLGPTARDVLDAMDASELPDLEVVIGCGFEPVGGVHLDELVAGEPGPIVDRDDDDLAVLVFTSGTAGRPRRR